MIEYDDGATPLNYDELKGLLPTHITTRGELDFLEMENINQAIIWSESLKTNDIINIEFICKLHKKMFSNVWKWAGKFRKSQKNIDIPYIQIEVDLQTLCDDAQAWKQYNTYSPDEFAARFHHRLVFIHPFSNGNGRHARLMADLILEKLFAAKVFSWGGESLTNHNKTRKEYIKALKMADEHDYSLLLEFVRS
ncbi:mobile mystery protein B [Desulfobacula sp.]|jgi:Fic-DOC domain mobile mystery protein B|uniref:mobile mystery protein B n=1 Tax=Desulfobacula sp. TaxID=2593537 RepID=UPI0039B8C852